MSTPFDPQPCTDGGGGGGTAGDDTELEILCDATPTPFLRQYLYSPTGTLLGTSDTELDGTTPFVPVEPVSSCQASGGGTVPTPAQLRNEAAFILCDATPTRFVRTYVRDGAGVLTATVDSTLAGAPFVPVAPVTVCMETVSVSGPVTVNGNVGITGQPISVDIDGQPVSVTGAVSIAGQPVAVTISGQPVSVTGNVGITGQPISVTGGPVSVTGTVGVTGPVTVTGNVGITGQPISVTGAVSITGQPVAVTNTPVTPTVTAQHFEATPGTPWTPASLGGTCTSLTYTVLTGTANVVDSNGTSITGLPAGYSATWDNTTEGTLTPPSAITSVGGRVIVHWTEK